jgi:tripartite-type tricarboxylate transporter receptor subunit TctC
MEGLMSLHRRRFLRLAAVAAALPAVSRNARAQDYPSRPVHIVVGFAAGGGSDVLARLTAEWLSERLGQPFVVENRPGAATNTATEMVVRALPDGHTLLMFSTSAFTNATLYDKLKFNFVRDIVPVASIARGALVMVVNSSVPAKTVREFITYAKHNPRMITMASAGAGSANHVAGELFNAMAGVDMLHVPYRGDAPALADLLGGQVQVNFSTIFGSIEYIRAGMLRALAVTTSARVDALPDVPALAEDLPGYEASVWNGLGAPKGTPTEVVDRLNAEINAGLADPTIMERLAYLGVVGHASSPAELGRLVVVETEKWGKIIKLAGIRAD